MFKPYGGEFIEEEDKKMVANITQFLCKVVDEHFTLVVNVLDSSGVVLYSEDTMKVLWAKNLYKPPPYVNCHIF